MKGATGARSFIDFSRQYWKTLDTAGSPKRFLTNLTYHREKSLTIKFIIVRPAKWNSNFSRWLV